jgi:hypothetical protein
VSALPERAVFYAAVAPLLAFYALFAAVIYPAAPALHWDASAVLAGVPAGLHGLVKVRVWFGGGSGRRDWRPAAALLAAVHTPGPGLRRKLTPPRLLRPPLTLPPKPQVVSNWTYSLFFCFAELWGSVVISVLFWWAACKCLSLRGQQPATRPPPAARRGVPAATPHPDSDRATRPAPQVPGQRDGHRG